MKKNLVLVILVMLVSYAHPQEGWTKLHPTATLKNLIDAHFINDNEGWVVGVDGLIMHTTDAGETWETQHSNDDESFWSVFFIDDQEGWVCGWSKVYHTDDAGLTWTAQSTPSCKGDFTDVFFMNQDTGCIVGSYEIVLRTENGGKTWGKIQNSIWDGMCFNRVDFIDDLNGCAVGGHHYGQSGFIMITDDGGKSWMETTPIDCEYLEGVEYIDSTTVWACGRDGCLLKSLDGGKTWTDMYSSYNSFYDINFYTDSIGVLLAGHNALLSFDAGNSWDSTVYIGSSSSLRSLMSWEENKSIAVGFNGAINKTLDGGSSWENLGCSMTACIYQIGYLSTMNGFAITNQTDKGRLIRTYDGGYSWEYDTILQQSVIYNMWVKDESCYFLNKDNQMIKTLDGGQNWEWISLPDNSPSFSGIHFVSENTGYLCSDEGVLLKTINGGQSWVDKSIDTIHYLRRISFINEDLGFMIDWDNKLILRTDNGGEDWTNSSLVSNIVCQPVDMCFYGNNTGYITTEEGCIFKTIDAGLTWKPHYAFSHNGFYSKITFVSETEGWYLNSSIRHTTDGGINWSEGVLFEGTLARGVFFMDEMQGWIGGGYCMVAKYDGSVKISENLPKASFISIFPNPVSDNLQVNFKQRLTKRAELIICNSEGKIVHRSTVAKGSDYLKLDLTELESSVYVLSINSDNFQETLKFVKL